MDPRVERTRAKVIEAALHLLRRGGPSAVTYSALADESGVGRATLYRHWPTLDDLWPVLYQAAQDRTALEPTGELKIDLVTALRWLADRVDSQEERASFVMMLERAVWDQETRQLARMVDEHGPVRQALELAIVNGELEDSIDLGSDISLLTGPLVHRALVAHQDIDDAFIDEVVEAYLAYRHSG